MRVPRVSRFAPRRDFSIPGILLRERRRHWARPKDGRGLPGSKQNRQKAYDDFIAAAEYLIAEKYTRPAKLAIHGSSNGGLLVGACMVQRPELFAACLPDVGTMDIFRFRKFGVGPYFVSDVGSPEDPDEFKALRAISPYHNLKRGVNPVLHAASGLFSGAVWKVFSGNLDTRSPHQTLLLK